MLLWALLAVWNPFDGFRPSLCVVGDVDGDGVSDVLVCARESFEAEAVWLLSGADGECIRVLESPREGSKFGRAMCAMGDLDRDGVPDFAISGNEYESGRVVETPRELSYPREDGRYLCDGRGRARERGYVRVYSGASGEVLFEIVSEQQGDGFGSVLAGGLDVDRDGVPDLVVGNPPLLVLVYSGAAGHPIRSLEPPFRHGRAIEAAWVWPRGLRLVPDVDESGGVDILVSGEERELLWGPDGGLGFQPYGEVTEHIALFSGAEGELLWERSEELGWYEGAGWQMDVLEDLDGDGSAELLVAAVDDSVRIVSLASGREVRRHSYSGGYMHAEGTTAGAIGDLDRDGVGDYAIAANETWDDDPGFVRVHSGRTGEELWLRGNHHPGRWLKPGQRPTPSDDMQDDGLDFCAPGDLDGDGTPDLIVLYRKQRRTVAVSGKDWATDLWQFVAE